MHCPSCGTATPSDQKFCRLCGIGLGGFAQLLDEALPSRLDPATAAAKEKDSRTECMAKLGLWGVTLLGIAGAALGGVIAYKIIASLIIQRGEVFAGLALLGCLVGVAMAVASLGYADTLRKFKTQNIDEFENKRKQAIPRALTAHESLIERKITAGMAPGLSLSVTEGTTELLESGGSPQRPRQAEPYD